MKQFLILIITFISIRCDAQQSDSTVIYMRSSPHFQKQYDTIKYIALVSDTSRGVNSVFSRPKTMTIYRIYESRKRSNFIVYKETVGRFDKDFEKINKNIVIWYEKPID